MGNRFNQLFSEQLKMKVSQVAAVLAVTASASAAPWKDGKKSWGGHWKGGWKNSQEDYICWNIVLENFRGEYQSAADTATHIHEAPKGQAGPPRLAFPNPVPVGDGKKRISIGCMMGPYETGIVSDGQDTAAGFKVKQI